MTPPAPDAPRGIAPPATAPRRTAAAPPHDGAGLPPAAATVADAAPTESTDPPDAPAEASGDAASDALADALADARADAFAEWVGTALLADPEATAWEDARFVAWLADEARAADRRARRTADVAFVAAGEAMLARAQARRLGVRRFVEPPEEALDERPVVTRGRGRARGRLPGRGYDRVYTRVYERAPGYAALGTDTRAAPLVELGVAAGPGRELWDEVPERWVRVPDAFPPGTYLAFRLVGTSMSPMLRSGDVVLVRADGAWGEARAGRVVVARHPDDGYVCKRVRRAGPSGVELGSLEPGHGPVRLPADARLVAGTVVAAWPGAGARR